jgi:hypothetical protein
MEFDKTKGFCGGSNIHDGGCEVTFHSLTHTHAEITSKNCRTCTCPLARDHRLNYSNAKRGIPE